MKNTIIKHFNDEDRNEVINIYEKYILAKEKDIPLFCKSFYPPNIWRYFQENFATKDFKVEVNGIFQEAERRMISFNNIYENPFPIAILKIENKSKFTKLTHRDFLGALMSLGIERNKMGDLLVHENVCYIPVHDEIKDFILYNIDKIGRASCKVEEVENIALLPSINFKEDVVLISSLRLDNIVCKLANTARGKAQDLIEQGMVQVDYVKIKEKSYEIKKDDRVTIRGIGKFIIGDIIGNSKSGKIKISVKKYT